MNETKHTPGPWYVDHDRVTVRAEMLAKPVQIAACGTPTSTYAQANARLVAAAPETAAERDRLREVNRELVAAMEATLASMRELRGLAFTGSRIPTDRYPEKHRANAADDQARAALARAKG